MATVSTKCDGRYGSHYTLYLEYTENSYSIANNTSNITVKMYAKSDSTSYKAYNTNATNPVKITVGGSAKVDKKIAMDFRNKKTVNMGSWTGDVKHDTNGKLTITIAGSFTINGVSSLSGGSVSKSWTLTTIPRASTVTCADGNIGSSTTINISRANSSFTHTITYNFSGLTGTIATKTSSTSIGWTIPTSFYAKIPNATNGKVTITCETFDDNTSIGTKTCTANMFVINSNPTVSATVVDNNSTTTALTGDNNKLVKYFSNAKVTITATAKNSATISSYKTTCGSKSDTSSAPIINSVESGTFNISTTDSRSLSASVSVTKTLVEYIKLTISKITLVRPSTISNTINANILGLVFNKSFGSVTNTMTLKYRWRETGGTWSSYSSLTPTLSNDTFSVIKELGTDFSYESDFEFEFLAEDKLMSANSKVLVPRGIPIIDIGKNDININVDTTFNKSLEVLGSTSLNQEYTSKAAIQLPNGAGDRSYWNSLPNGWYWYGNTNVVPNMPSSYGFVEKRGFVSGGDFTILFYQQSSGSIYRKSGNSSSITGWYRIYQTQRILWEGAMYMNGSQTATLSERVSEQVNGIVLVFTGYSNGSAQNWNTVCRFVPKKKIELLNGVGEFIPLGGTEGVSGFKYVYLTDTGVGGNDKNQQSISNGITYNNYDYVLRYVIGV